MFSCKRYVTARVCREVPSVFQAFMWRCVDTIPIEPDYLQASEFNTVANVQQIIHSQEVSEYRAEYTILFDKPISLKIYIIDDGDHATMLFADEY